MGRYGDGLGKRLRGARKGSPEVPVRLSAKAGPSDFMTRRRMFAVVDGVARVAEPGDSRFHREWLRDVAPADFDRVVRGYLLDSELVFYKGSFGIVSVPEIRECLPGLAALLDLPEDTFVYTGALPADGDDLKGQHMVGDLRDLTEEWPVLLSSSRVT